MENENKKNYFNIDREGWIVFMLLSVIQAFIWYASHVHSASSSALNYVSFAGTLISIILAVLAIGYTYGESVKQKNESNTLSSQLDELVKITKNLRINSNSFNELNNIKNNLGEIVEKIEDGFKQTKEKVSSIQESIKQSQSIDSLITKNNTTQILKSSEKKELFEHLAKVGTPITITSILLSFIAIKKFSHLKDAGEQITACLDYYVITLSDTDENESLFWHGATTNMLAILTGLEIIKMEDNKLMESVDISFIKSIESEILVKPWKSKSNSTKDAIDELVLDFQKTYCLELKKPE